jgi:hypothetical protein
MPRWSATPRHTPLMILPCFGLSNGYLAGSSAGCVPEVLSPDGTERRYRVPGSDEKGMLPLLSGKTVVGDYQAAFRQESGINQGVPRACQRFRLGVMEA